MLPPVSTSTRIWSPAPLPTGESTVLSGPGSLSIHSERLTGSSGEEAGDHGSGTEAHLYKQCHELVGEDRPWQHRPVLLRVRDLETWPEGGGGATQQRNRL